MTNEQSYAQQAAKGPRPRLHRRSWLATVCIAILATSASTTSAWAHGAGETTEGYVLVQQALGHLAHDSSHLGIEAAMEKVNDALATKDQVGVDVKEVKLAQTALTADRVEQARVLLQHSITTATNNLMPAIGEETGTSVILLPQPGRGSLTTAEWALGSVSLLLVLSGVALAAWFRPHQNLKQLRHLLNPAAPVRSHARSGGQRP